MEVPLGSSAQPYCPQRASAMYRLERDPDAILSAHLAHTLVMTTYRLMHTMKAIGAISTTVSHDRTERRMTGNGLTEVVGHDQILFEGMLRPNGNNWFERLESAITSIRLACRLPPGSLFLKDVEQGHDVTQTTADKD